MTLKEFFERYYRPLRLRNRANNTLRLYRRSIRAFSLFLEHDALLSDFEDDTVCAYLAHLIGRELSPYTVNKERSQLLAIWNYAARKRFVEKFPDVQAERLPVRAPLAWEVNEYTKLMQACANLTGQVGMVPANLWWLALHYVMFDTAERIGAIMQLDWKHINGRWVTFIAETRKGRRADNVRLLAEDSRQLLDKLHPYSREKVFPWPYHSKYLWSKYATILKAAGLPSDAKSKFHRMRRTVASHYHAAGGDASELLTHTDPRVTRRYLDCRITAKIQPADMLPRPSVLL